MRRDVVTVPRGLLRFLDMSWDIDWGGQGLGQNNAGNGQIVFNRFPRWIGQPRILLHREQVLAWRAVRAQAQGRVGLYRVPLTDPLGFKLTDAGASEATIETGLPFADGAYFTDETGWAYEPFVTVSGAAAAGATEITIDTAPVPGFVPKVGQIMSHEDWPFQVQSVVDAGSGLFDLTVQMPLRAAIPSGDLVYLGAWGLFEANDGSGNPGYAPALVSRPTLEFTEALRR